MSGEIRILVVDDEPIVVMSAGRVLKAEGYAVDGAASGREAMGMIERNRYDLVLTDLKMLEVDGISLIRWMRQHRPDIAVVVITGHLLQETIKEALKLGVHDHMMKPFTPAALKDVIYKTLACMRETAAGGTTAEEFSLPHLAELDRVIERYRNEPGGATPVLLAAQEIFGYLPAAIQKRIARGLDRYPSEIQSIVSSNPFFRTEQAGDCRLRVCSCIECYLKGSERVLGWVREALEISVGETTRDGRFTLDAGRCVHACGQGPVMAVGRTAYRWLTRRKTIDAINGYSSVHAVPAAGDRGPAGKEHYDA